jgi:hypothetical protein
MSPNVTEDNVCRTADVPETAAYGEWAARQRPPEATRRCRRRPHRPRGRRACISRLLGDVPPPRGLEERRAGPAPDARTRRPGGAVLCTFCHIDVEDGPLPDWSCPLATTPRGSSLACGCPLESLPPWRPGCVTHLLRRTGLAARPSTTADSPRVTQAYNSLADAAMPARRRSRRSVRSPSAAQIRPAAQYPGAARSPAVPQHSLGEALPVRPRRGPPCRASA